MGITLGAACGGSECGTVSEAYVSIITRGPGNDIEVSVDGRKLGNPRTGGQKIGNYTLRGMEDDSSIPDSGNRSMRALIGSTTDGMKLPSTVVSGKPLYELMDKIDETFHIKVKSGSNLTVYNVLFRFIFQEGETIYIKPWKLLNSARGGPMHAEKEVSGTDGTLAKPHDKWDYFQWDTNKQFLDVLINAKDLERRNENGNLSGSANDYLGHLDDNRYLILAGGGYHVDNRDLNTSKVTGRVHRRSVFKYIQNENPEPKVHPKDVVMILTKPQLVTPAEDTFRNGYLTKTDHAQVTRSPASQGKIETRDLISWPEQTDVPGPKNAYGSRPSYKYTFKTNDDGTTELETQDVDGSHLNQNLADPFGDFVGTDMNHRVYIGGPYYDKAYRYPGWNIGGGRFREEGTRTTTNAPRRNFKVLNKAGAVTGDYNDPCASVSNNATGTAGFGAMGGPGRLLHYHQAGPDTMACFVHVANNQALIAAVSTGGIFDKTNAIANSKMTSPASTDPRVQWCTANPERFSEAVSSGNMSKCSQFVADDPHGIMSLCQGKALENKDVWNMCVLAVNGNSINDGAKSFVRDKLYGHCTFDPNNPELQMVHTDMGCACSLAAQWQNTQYYDTNSNNPCHRDNHRASQNCKPLVDQLAVYAADKARYEGQDALGAAQTVQASINLLLGRPECAPVSNGGNKMCDTQTINQDRHNYVPIGYPQTSCPTNIACINSLKNENSQIDSIGQFSTQTCNCLLYTSPSPRDLSTSRMPSSA